MAKKKKQRRRRRPPVASRVLKAGIRFQSQGAHHDLRAIAREVIQGHDDIFGRSFWVGITWGRPIKRRHDGRPRPHFLARLFLFIYPIR